MENVIDCYNKSGYPIPQDKFDYSAKQFDYWDMVGFAEMYARTIRTECEGKADSTSGKDLRVCEVIASASRSKMCGNCKSFEPISRGESFVVLQGKCDAFQNKIVWKDGECDRFRSM